MSSKYIHGTDPSEQNRLAELNRLTNQPFIEFLRPGNKETILEVGSGLGILAGEIALQYPDCSVYGIEYNWTQLTQARELSEHGVRFCQADAHSLPFPEESFDIVYCRYLLEHVSNPVQVLKEMLRVLKSGGKISIQENNILVNEFYPGCENFERIWRKFAELQSRLGGDALIGKKLFPLLKEAGFKEIELSIQPQIHYSGEPNFRPWIENLIGNIHSGMSQLLSHGLAEKEEIDLAISELETLMEREDASAFFYWNRAEAVK